MKTATILVLIVSLTATAATKQQVDDLSKKLASGLNEMKILSDVYAEKSFVIDGQEQVLDPNQLFQIQSGFYDVRSRLSKEVDAVDVVDVNMPYNGVPSMPFVIALASVKEYLGEASRCASLIEEGWKVTDSVTINMNTSQTKKLATKQAVSIQCVALCINAITLRKEDFDETTN